MTTSERIIISFDAEKASRYLLNGLLGFVSDPPESDYQRGYLAALLTAYREGLGKGAGDDRLKALDAMLEVSNG